MSPGKLARRQAKHPRRGGSLVEFALVLPMLFILMINVVNFGGMMYAWIAVSNAARAGALYMAAGGASANGPALPSDTNTAQLVKDDLHSLPNSSSVTVSVCTKYSSPACAPPTDPEGTAFADGYVDVTYTYQAFFSGPSFLGWHLTTPQTRIHRKEIMRLMQ